MLLTSMFFYVSSKEQRLLFEILDIRETFDSVNSIEIKSAKCSCIINAIDDNFKYFKANLYPFSDLAGMMPRSMKRYLLNESPKGIINIYFYVDKLTLFYTSIYIFDSNPFSKNSNDYIFLRNILQTEDNYYLISFINNSRYMASLDLNISVFELLNCKKSW